MREYTYRIDLDGLIWQGGEYYDAPEIYAMFHRGMTRAEDGRLFAVCMGETCWVVPEDTPFVVDRVRIRTVAEPSGDPAKDLAGVTLVLKGGVEEPLDPETLGVGAGNVLYTMVREGAFPARFSRPAYYELARWIVPEGDEFALYVGGRRHPVGGDVGGDAGGDNGGENGGTAR